MARIVLNTNPPRSPDEIKRLIEVYPPSWRRWCEAPFSGGCACRGCVHHPAPSTVSGDPEYREFPNPADRLSKEEVEIYLAKHDHTGHFDCPHPDCAREVV